MTKTIKNLFVVLMIVVAMTLACVVVTGCQNKEVECTFYSDTAEPIVLKGKTGTDIEFPTLNRDGYTFEGWYNNARFEGEAVTGAKFGDFSAFYAKWIKVEVYKLTLNLDGGTLSAGTEFMVAPNTNLKNYVSGFIPTKSDLQFGAWFIGEEVLSNTAVMPQGDLTLKAKYKAQYTVNILLEEGKTGVYVKDTTKTKTGFAYVGESFLPDVKVDYFTQSNTVNAIVIGENKQNNVFNYNFDRNQYTLTYNANTGDEEPVTQTVTYVYGMGFELIDSLAENTEERRFLGWATTQNGAYVDVLTEEDTEEIGGDIVLYAVWNKAYTDAFGGDDVIFLEYGNSKRDAVLYRGGAEINGKKSGSFYKFEGENITIYATLNPAGKFVYTYNRNGNYLLYVDGRINKNVTIELDDTNNITYYSFEENNYNIAYGTYTMDESGYFYVATFTDGTYFMFATGTTKDQNGATASVFVKRGEEYSYGALAYHGAYYPTFTLDGFGYVTYDNGTSTTNYLYTIEGDYVYITDASYNVQAVLALDYYYVEMVNRRLFGYDFYNSQYDHVYACGDTATLKVDGKSTAVYTDSATNTTLTGMYAVNGTSKLGGSYLMMRDADDQMHYFRIYTEGSDYKFVKISEDYAEYQLLNNDGKISSDTLLVVTGEDTAELWGKNESVYELISSGSFVEQTLGYLYTVEGEIAEWAEQVTSMLIDLNTDTSYSVYYVLGADDEKYGLEYQNGDKKLVEYANAIVYYFEGETLVAYGVKSYYTAFPEYVYITYDETNYVFELGEGTFEVLDTEPFAVSRSNAPAGTTATLMVTGKSVEEGKYEAIYSEKTDGTTVTYTGYYTAYGYASLEKEDQSYTVNSFVATDGETLTFKFVMLTNGRFDSYDVDETITFISYTVIAETTEVDTSKISLIDEEQISGEDKYSAMLYVDAEGNETKGFVTAKEVVNPFDNEEYATLVYTFTAENITFKFSLNGGKFRMCGEDATYTAEGATLEVDGKTRYVRYEKDGESKIGYALVVTNTQDENGLAYYVNFNGTTNYFDIQGNNFALRGTEAGGYVIVDNGQMNSYLVVLDGHNGGYVQNTDDETKLDITYVLSEIEGRQICTVTANEETVVTVMGTYKAGNNSYRALYLQIEGIAGYYMDYSDLSVIVIDDIGNVTKYNSYGQKIEGIYVLVDDNLLYYQSNNGTDSAMYKLSENKAVASDYYAIYYADDFASVIFYTNGVLVFNNNMSERLFYTVDEDNTIYTYKRDDSGNKYGYLKELYTGISNDGNTIVYADGTNGGNPRTYTKFDLEEGTLCFDSENGEQFVFSPSGATFTVNATLYDAEGNADTGYYAIVSYDSEGEVHMYIAKVQNTTLNGGVFYYSRQPKLYTLTCTYDATFNMEEKSFACDFTTYEATLSAYDYMYAYILAMYGNAYAVLFEGLYGQITLTGQGKGNDIVYSVSGKFNYVKGTDDEILSFENGIISKAGIVSTYYSNSYAVEFVGSDGETYHMLMFVTYDTYFGGYKYLIYSLSRVTETIELGEGTYVYKEEFVYTTGFNIPKNDEGTEYYEVGDEYINFLKYNGEIVCAFNIMEDERHENTDIFVAYEYSVVNGSVVYWIDYYYFNYILVDGELQGGTVSKLNYTNNLKTLEGDKLEVLFSAETGEIVEVISVTAFGEEMSEVTEYVNNGNGIFTLTLSNGKVYVLVEKKDSSFYYIITEVTEYVNSGDGTYTFKIGDEEYTITVETKDGVTSYIVEEVVKEDVEENE